MASKTSHATPPRLAFFTTAARKTPYRLPRAARRLENTQPPLAARALTAPPPTSPPPSDVFLLDLDGVLVDSAGELASSAYTCAVDRWPEAMAASGHSREAILAGLAGGRPRVIAGYEALAMARLVAELGPEDGVAAVLADWPGATLEAALARWGESTATLAPAFEAHRAAAAVDEAAWLACNRAYPGIVPALAAVCGPWYVVSSKSAPRVALLLRGLLGQGGPDFQVGGRRLWAGLQPPDTAKPAAIEDLTALVWDGGLASEQAPTIHFVDDRYETLAAVCASPSLGPAVASGGLRLYHATWGYAAAGEAAAAAADPGVTCLDLGAFIELLCVGGGRGGV